MEQLSNKALDLISAALRHIRDAESLIDKSPDQAMHLAGFGPECVRKATLSDRFFDLALGHKMGELANGILKIAVDLDPWTLRYQLFDWESRFHNLSKWKPAYRYERTGRFSSQEARNLVCEAYEVVINLVSSLWADGRLPPDVI